MAHQESEKRVRSDRRRTDRRTGQDVSYTGPERRGTDRRTGERRKTARS
jgi:hypothetical protein